MFDVDESISDEPINYGALTQAQEPLDYISPYKPVVFDGLEYQFNRLLCGGRVVRGHYADNTFGFCAQNISDTSVLVSSRYFRVTLPQCEFILELGLDVLQFSLQQLKVPDALDHLPTHLRNAVFTAAIESFAGQAFGVSPLSITPVEPTDISEQVRGFAGEFLGGDQANPTKLLIHVFVHIDFLPRVVEWLATLEPAGLSPAPAIQNLPIETFFVLDEFFVAQSVVESLKAGDLVITDGEKDEVLVRVGQKLQQKGRFMNDNVTLEGYLEEFEQSLSDEESVSYSPADMSSQRFSEAKDLFQDIPVKMTFILAQQEFTLEQLRQLNQGQCLPVSNSSPSEITVLLNGKVFAKGELVQIEDQLGVRIVKFVNA